MRKIKQTIPVGKLALNEGQISWLPRNPRQWIKSDIDKMIVSLDEDPDFMEDRPPLVTPQEDGGFCVFAGNERTEAEKRRGKRQEIECVVYYPEGDDDRQTIIRRAIKDNGHFGSWDADILANEWDVPLADWGVPDWVSGGSGDIAEPKKTGEINLSTLGDTIELKISLAADEYSFVKSVLSEAGETDREGLLSLCGYGEE